MSHWYVEKGSVKPLSIELQLHGQEPRPALVYLEEVETWPTPRGWAARIRVESPEGEVLRREHCGASMFTDAIRAWVEEALTVNRVK
jgi:hypothetical protein